eukprot:m.64399 g.64399  ORF g.64399 m.64399 type:complete len:1760 (-) comp12014_c0_seq1:3339-8618(-)
MSHRSHESLSSMRHLGHSMPDLSVQVKSTDGDDEGSVNSRRTSSSSLRRRSTARSSGFSTLDPGKITSRPVSRGSRRNRPDWQTMRFSINPMDSTEARGRDVDARVHFGGERTKSLSPPRRDSASTSAFSSFFQERFDHVAKAFKDQLDVFYRDLPSYDEQEFGVADSRYAAEQLKLLTMDALAVAQKQQMNGAYFQELSGNLMKLLGVCSAEDPTARRIQDLVHIIARPARLLECLEFNPQDIQQTELSKEEAHQRLLSLTTADASTLPSYVFRKIATDFGGGEDGSSHGLRSTVDQPLANFLTEPVVPCKQDFEFLKQLSSGAYGGVWLAKHVRTEESVAVKVLKKRDMINKNFVQQVMAEKDILQFARNPFLINLLCSFTTKESLYIVMEYAPGGDLAAYLKLFTVMSLCQARRYFSEAVLAVEYIHDFGIVHRDLKPDNFIIGRDGHVKLTDFGLSKIGLMTQTTLLAEDGPISGDISSFKDSQVMGTPDYIAPEVVLGQGYGKPVDWWSMGIILYEFLCGVPPFAADTVQDIFDNTVHAQVFFPDDEICEEARDLILQLLDKDPEKRLGTPPSPAQLPDWDTPMPGAYYVKEHDLFQIDVLDEDTNEAEGPIDWDNLLLQKANFVPVLDDELDTSYFDSRADRYHHTLSSSSDEDDSDSTSQSDNDYFKNFACVNTHSTPQTPTPGSPAPGLLSSSRNASFSDSFFSHKRSQSVGAHDAQQLYGAHARVGLQTTSPSRDPSPQTGRRSFGSKLTQDEVTMREARTTLRRMSVTVADRPDRAFMKSAPTTPRSSDGGNGFSRFSFECGSTSPLSQKHRRASSRSDGGDKGHHSPPPDLFSSTLDPSLPVDRPISFSASPSLQSSPKLVRRQSSLATPSSPPLSPSQSLSTSSAPITLPNVRVDEGDGGIRQGRPKKTGNGRLGSSAAGAASDSVAASASESADGSLAPPLTPTAMALGSPGHLPPYYITVNVTATDEHGLGFMFRSSFGKKYRHIVVRVASECSAAKQGMVPNLAVVEADGVDVTRWSHEKLSRYIRAKAAGGTVNLLLIDPKKEKKHKRNKGSFKNKLRASLRKRFTKNPSRDGSPSRPGKGLMARLTSPASFRKRKQQPHHHQQHQQQQHSPPRSPTHSIHEVKSPQSSLRRSEGASSPDSSRPQSREGGLSTGSGGLSRSRSESHSKGRSMFDAFRRSVSSRLSSPRSTVQFDTDTDEGLASSSERGARRDAMAAAATSVVSLSRSMVQELDRNAAMKMLNASADDRAPPSRSASSDAPGASTSSSMSPDGVGGSSQSGSAGLLVSPVGSKMRTSIRSPLRSVTGSPSSSGRGDSWSPTLDHLSQPARPSSFHGSPSSVSAASTGAIVSLHGEAPPYQQQHSSALTSNASTAPSSPTRSASQGSAPHPVGAGAHSPTQRPSSPDSRPTSRSGSLHRPSTTPSRPSPLATEPSSPVLSPRGSAHRPPFQQHFELPMAAADTSPTSKSDYGARDQYHRAHHLYQQHGQIQQQHGEQQQQQRRRQRSLDLSPQQTRTASMDKDDDDAIAQHWAHLVEAVDASLNRVNSSSSLSVMLPGQEEEYTRSVSSRNVSGSGAKSKDAMSNPSSSLFARTLQRRTSVSSRSSSTSSLGSARFSDWKPSAPPRSVRASLTSHQGTSPPRVASTRSPGDDEMPIGIMPTGYALPAGDCRSESTDASTSPATLTSLASRKESPARSRSRSPRMPSLSPTINLKQQMEAQQSLSRSSNAQRAAGNDDGDDDDEII